MIKLLLEILIVIPLIITVLLAYHLRRNGQGVVGRRPVNSVLFYAAKISLAGQIAVLTAVSFAPSFYGALPWCFQAEIPDVQ
ncbi:MAG: hypothetical protein LBR06_03570, partial [Bacteroidales bacterium]|nr:hypothetical protein [Bacteroidales bacterium]